MAIWFRITSPNVPAANGDEHFYGVQAAKLLRGQPIASDTSSGNILNGLVLGTVLPLYAALGPSSLAIKIPPIVAGLLAVVAAYSLFGRVLDRGTGLIAGTLMAVLPVAIIECRFGSEPAWNPLVGIIALALAFRGHRLGLLLAFLLCYYVHPTYLFFLPVILSVLLVKLWERTAGDPRLRRRTLAGTALLFGPTIGLLAWVTSGRSAIQWLYETFDFGPCDWGRFVVLYERLLMGFVEMAPPETSRAYDLAFWAVFGTILAAGTAVLIRRRCWDRVALIAGLIVSLCGMHLVTGPDILRPYFVRYGLFLVAPSVLAFSCCVRALIVAPRGGWRTSAHGLQVAAIACLACGLLFEAKYVFFDHLFNGFNGPERFWTLRTESVDPYEWLATIVVEDAAATGTDPGPERVVLAEDWWIYRPIEYYTSRRDGIRVGSLEGMDGALRDRLIRKHLEAGGYVAGTDGQPVIGRAESLYRPDQLREWHVHCRPYPVFTLCRLRRSDEATDPRPALVLRPPEAGAETPRR